LLIHAFFKAMLFISVGEFIHLTDNYQSIMKSGSLYFSANINSSSRIVSCLGLMGAPFTGAYFSKEPILERFMFQNSRRLYLWFVVLWGLNLTVVYRVRFLYLVVLK